VALLVEPSSADVVAVLGVEGDDVSERLPSEVRSVEGMVLLSLESRGTGKDCSC